MSDTRPRTTQGSPSRAPGWYLVDYDTFACLRGPYKSDETAGAVRREIEGDRNIWIVDSDTLNVWEAQGVSPGQDPPSADEPMDRANGPGVETNRRANGVYLLVEQPECKHTPHPRGLREHLDWQEEKAKTHRQERCPICGLWAVWVPK